MWVVSFMFACNIYIFLHTVSVVLVIASAAGIFVLAVWYVNDQLPLVGYFMPMLVGYMCM